LLDIKPDPFYELLFAFRAVSVIAFMTRDIADVYILDAC
jgi:hypothetical protein